MLVSASADPDDNGILEWALASKSDLVVSGDNDLLSLRVFEGIPIVNPRQVLTLLLSNP
jgi:predicted nucleic acid-binding protein